MSAQLQLDVLSFGPPPASTPAVLVAIADDDELVTAVDAEAAIAEEAAALVADARRAPPCQCIPSPALIFAPDSCWRCGRSADGWTAYGIATLILDNDAGAELPTEGTDR